ncbi:unnamed protein product [Sphagnum troendelagicum]|uniref:Uncharacterized protein n=2 Tax=Sphagnum troendelagicum TaxID=128251 RepID=A0ABP0T6N0_9BRYO
MPRVKYTSRVADGTVIQTRPLAISIPRAPTLRHLYPRTALANTVCVPLRPFPPLAGPCSNLSEHPQINDPNSIDLDAACFIMLTRDLPTLFGIMARPANRKVPVKDLSDFDDWLHVISDPIVVKVYAGSDVDQRAQFKDELVNTLRRAFGMTLTCSPDSLTLSRNQVNVPIAAMSDVLHSLGARICRVSFFGMKWDIPNAEPVIDRFIQQYHANMGSSVPLQKNVFDYGVRFPTTGLQLYKFSEIQREAHKFREEVHGRDAYAPSIRVRSVYTFARQAIGWSGKFMGRQLRQARDWSEVVAEASTRQMAEKGPSEFGYDSWELDSPEVRPLIQDFLEHAEWFLFNRVRDRTIPGLMLRKPNGGGYLPKKGIYDDRVGAARHYIGLYGADWRDHVSSIQ